MPADKPKILRFHPEKCTGCLECEKACSKVHFKTEDGGEKSAIRIIQKDGVYEMHVCNQCGLCIDICPVGALERKSTGAVILNKTACIGCQACVGFCPTGDMRRASISITPFKCIACGMCVTACPEKALELVPVDIDEVKQVVYFAFHD